MEYVVNSPEETLMVAKSLAETLTGGEIVLLTGELGAGKTVFAKGIALGLGVEDTVTSPTFTIMNEYSGRLTMYHFDMYRLNGEKQELGFEEYFGASDTVCVIEWNVSEDFGDARIIRVDIEYMGEHDRRITIYEDLMR
ncbi:MAG: tRNA (adenosine(37)-N6)-threonylcarbamoyltransferase complex ATPase subunit type 1 TsaE [Clostridia bacterium]|nr:tRNA (adenosine(37)-N6)-threonylcarbamoyltransferase complex ATPase subunit type 1 TsaE [Clostridia bacterium]